MSQQSADILRSVSRLSDKIDLIPRDPDCVYRFQFFKDGFGTEEKMCCSRSAALAKQGHRKRNQRCRAFCRGTATFVYMISA